MAADLPIKWDAQGLVPAVVQDAASGEVLMLAYMNAHTLQLTLETGQTHFWSRSRQEVWHKGATSGNVQDVVGIWLDCDGDIGDPAQQETVKRITQHREEGIARHARKKQRYTRDFTADRRQPPVVEATVKSQRLAKV